MGNEMHMLANSRQLDARSERHKLLTALARRFCLHGIIYMHLTGGELTGQTLWLAHTFQEDVAMQLECEHMPTLQQMLRLGHNCVRPRPLSECMQLHKLARGLPLEVKKGFVFPLHGPHGSFALVLALHEDETALKQQMPALHLFMTRFFERFLEYAAQHQQAKATDAQLSRRELECLYWCACGKSYWETAVILGLSERTVTHHMNTVRRKLGVQSNAQAVAIASLNGLFVDIICEPTPPPRRQA